MAGRESNGRAQRPRTAASSVKCRQRLGFKVPGSRAPPVGRPAPPRRCAASDPRLSGPSSPSPAMAGQWKVTEMVKSKTLCFQWLVGASSSRLRSPWVPYQKPTPGVIDTFLATRRS
jgi:hypothetical protein